MRQSMEFDDVLNECLERLLHGETVDQCLSRFPQYADKLKPLLDTGLQVKQATSVQPRPEFRINARRQFQAALNASESHPKASFLWWLKQPRWAAVTAFALLVVLGTATGALANSSMPDQPLYPVKLAMEKIQVSLTRSTAARGELYARLLERRLVEISKMAEENKPDKIGVVTGHLDSFVAGITVSTTTMTERNAAPELAPQLPTAAAPTAPPSPDAAPPPQAGAPGIMMAEPFVASPVAAEGNITMVPADTAALPVVPMLEKAAANLVRLRSLVKAAPESERQALLDAINAAEKTYQAIISYVSTN